MANPDDALNPMTDADVKATSGNAARAADPVKDAAGTAKTTLADAKASLKDQAQSLSQQAGDKARTLADDGKAKATGALDDLSKMLTDAAGQVDEKLGAQYGQYARSAADRVQGLSSSLNEKSVDDLIEDVRGLVRKSPAVAIGAAAAVGFVLARVLSSGFDRDDRA